MWQPTYYTPSLSGTEDFPTQGDRLIRLIEKYWKVPESDEPFRLDDWQKWVIRHVLEVFPEGHPKAGELRFRQVLVSMGRQNGKSVLGGIFGAFGLFWHVQGPQVLSLASNADQAGIIFERVYHVIKQQPNLRNKAKATMTRGIGLKDGTGHYRVKPAKADAVQGIPVSLCLFDEVHISKTELWDAVVNGIRARKNGMVIGITTAGDDQSALLKRLYKQGMDAVNQQGNYDERFGFFLWEAPEGSTIEPGPIMQANPAIACGRIDVNQVINDVRNLPETDQQRYVLNRFVASTANWLPMNAWWACSGKGIPQDYTGPVIYSVDRAPDWQYATITAAAKIGGKVYTEVVASIVKPSLAQLVRVCVGLRKNGQCTFVMDGYQLPKLATELKTRGLVCHALSLKELSDACSTSYALIVQKKVEHADDDLLRQQMPRGIRKNSGEAWRISRADSSVEIDALLSTVMGIYLAETLRKETAQLF